MNISADSTKHELPRAGLELSNENAGELRSGLEVAHSAAQIGPVSRQLAALQAILLDAEFSHHDIEKIHDAIRSAGLTLAPTKDSAS